MTHAAENKRPWRSGPLQRTVALGDYAVDSYVVRLYWGDESKVLWVDFEIFHVVAHEIATGHWNMKDGARVGNPAYHDDNLRFVTDVDAAQPVVTGFVKWDGCTQFRLGGNGAHVDSRAQLNAWTSAIDHARGFAAEAMTPDADVRVDHGLEVVLRPLDGSGQHVPWSDFAALCKAGTYVDADGFAELATTEEVSELSVAPSRADMDFRPPWATHVVWYGRTGSP